VKSVKGCVASSERRGGKTLTRAAASPYSSPPTSHRPLRTPSAKLGDAGEGGGGIYCFSARPAVVLEADHRAGDLRRPCDDDDAVGGAGDAGAPRRTRALEAGGAQGSGDGAGPMGSLGPFWVQAATGFPSFSGAARCCNAGAGTLAVCWALGR
jgi:hypothetical protein